MRQESLAQAGGGGVTFKTIQTNVAKNCHTPSDTAAYLSYNIKQIVASNIIHYATKQIDYTFPHWSEKEYKHQMRPSSTDWEIFMSYSSL